MQPKQGGIIMLMATAIRLEHVKELPGLEPLLDKLRRDDQSAYAELNAISLFRKDSCAEIDLFPEIERHGGMKVPDFRVRLGDGPWVYVEVTRPDLSELSKQTMAWAVELSGVVRLIDRPMVVEVVLHREPNAVDSTGLQASILEFCRSNAARHELPEGLGFLQTRESLKAAMEDQAPAEEERPPYVVAMSSASEEGEAVRNVIVRMPLLDERVADLFRVEARQLPKDWPGLIMFDVSELPTVFQAWQPLIKRRFQPTLNTRVGAVCLFASGLFVQVSGAPSDSGVRVQQLTR
jgi:hypothetical protein